MSSFGLVEPTLKDILSVINPLREDWDTRFRLINDLREVVESVESFRGNYCFLIICCFHFVSYLMFELYEDDGAFLLVWNFSDLVLSYSFKTFICWVVFSHSTLIYRPRLECFIYELFKFLNWACLKFFSSFLI